jgi:DNA polymerase-2
MQARGFILQPTYRVRHGRPVIQLYGRLESGEAFLVEDDRFRPYFFALKTDASALAGLSDIEIEETGLRDFRGREVIRINASIPAAVPPLRDRLEAGGLPCFESDIRFPYRYLIDWGIRASVEIDGPAEVVRAGFVRFHNPSLAACSWRPSLRQLSLDLETTRDASQIFSAALATDDGVEEVHLVHRSAVTGAICHGDESQLLAAVSQRIRELDPDIITGWNVVDFDLRTWLKRCEALGVPGRIGRAGGAVTFQQDARFARQSRAEVPGRVVLDGIPLVRDAIRLADYRLETVARALLGRGKLIDADAHDPVEEIQRLYREEPEKLAAYNLEDARLVLEILEHEGLVDLAIERSLLCGMQLDRVGASIASFDLVYLPELRRRGVVAPSVDASRKTAVVRGGALLEPVPGLFRNVAVYDFKSLYPSLIRTFNLDPLAHARALHGESGAPQTIDAPNGARFSRAEAILPSVIERFLERREAAKQRGDRYADQAIKIMMNAMFGVLGAASCRFFDPEIANAITGFGQQTLHWTRDALRAEGVEVLYGDTDSVFVQLRSRSSRARAEAEALRSRVEEQISGRIREQYRVEPKLRLELERVFDRLFLPKVRGGSSGSKKRYAGSVDGRLEIVGLEAVRRDWPAIAGRLQRGLLERLFSDRDVMPFAIDLVASVRAGECDDELVYAKRVRKASVESYTASTPPHIQAARKAGGAAGPVIRYLITEQGPEPVLPGRPLPEHIDRRHYLDRVLRPIADGILSQVGHDFDEVLGEPHQLDLL